VLTAAPPARRAGVGLAGVVVCVGLVFMVVGTFLPWLKSGRVSRNSYASDGALRQLLHVGGPGGAVLDAWPFVSLAGAVAIALTLIGLRRCGAVIALVAGACAGGVAIWALVASAHGLIRPATFGPAATLAGGILTCLAALANLVPLSRATRRSR
jgi:hypothetical protein